MKLKKLELFGFKSFYDKISFDFSDGITAIVGPNGCGKSNIVDAVRWVLGEHAPSYLRSKALEDVIFAGSDAAGPLGLAEVSLTFSTEDGVAPPGYESYAEVQVTRRTFRDGESEFFINRIPCRLKDIAELFLDTGAGARGYAIIEQGKIMTIVNARPEEKRMIIEEAAGVAKFRVRRKEAERKMESTRQNLARVRDILDEVKRQLGSLERQVRKAERYKALKDELRELDYSIAGRKFLLFKEERAGIAERVSSLETALLSLRSGIAALEAERESEKLHLAEAEAAVGSLRAGHAGIKEKIARQQAEWEGKGREARQLRDLIAETREEIAALEGETGELSRRIREAEDAALKGREDLASSRERLVGLAGEAEKAQAEFGEAQEMAERAKSDLIVRVTLHSNALSGAESIQKLVEENARTVARLNDRVAEAEVVVRKAEEQHTAACVSEERAREALVSAERAWEETGSLLAEENARLDTIADTRRITEGRLEATGSRWSALSRVQQQRDWASSGVRAVLHHYLGDGNGDGSDGCGIYGVIGELLETDARYERAVEAVLGERIQSIVVRDHEDGLSALQYLKESREGRGAFVPVTLRTREELPPYGGEEGVIGPLIDVVRVSRECGDLVRGLLGGTLLVRDLSCALRLWNRNGVWSSYVTLDGDLITADGILSGGALEQGESRVLAVKREIRELEEEMTRLSGESARIAKEEEEARHARATLEEKLTERFSLREEQKARYAEAQQKRAVVEVAMAQARTALGSLVQERRYLEDELARITAERSESEEAARISSLARQEEEGRVRTLVALVEEKRAVVEGLRTKLHAAEIEWTGLEEKFRSADALIGGLRESLDSRLATVEERRKRITAHEKSVRELELAVEEGRDAIEAAAVDLARRQEEIDRHLGENAALAARIASMEGALKEMRQREAAEVARLSDLRLAAQRLDMDLEHLDLAIYQKYGVHPSEIGSREGPQEKESGDLAGWETRAGEVRAKMAAIGEVNLASLEEHRELLERHDFLFSQKEDLEKSLEDLARAIQRINRTTRERFSTAFDSINRKFQEIFPKLFLGGRAYLKLVDEGNLLESGVEIVAQPPGKKLQSLNLLSGGEKALTAISLIFSIFLVKPSPFCLLDEADAPLDDANIDRFNSIVREMSSNYQFLLITHNKRTMELADVLYGITMEKPGISKVVSVKFQS
ncbi:MAG TPA: chromosome segregation protein SMC [Candidatus Deferrimicrobiaceae bacterium]|nr:chromosome segregation protein SMC [Candidatus Deferrimicrobiaceae bacterium]